MEDLESKSTEKVVRILGTHGVPASYGGFETAVENIALHLVRRGWRVIVYCQTAGSGEITHDVWNGVERVLVPVDLPSWKGSGYFDWKCYQHAIRFKDPCAVFGYNTGILNLLLKARGIPFVINMDGIEWKRARWSKPLKAVLWLNERFAAWLGDRLIADHPAIARYLETRAPAKKISTIAYGADAVLNAPCEPLNAYGLVSREFLTLIARPMPENSILEIVRTFSSKRRDKTLVILGKYDATADAYHRAVLEAASDEVMFVGGIYEKAVLRSLRYHSLAYLHGHKVGGTNPSLVEALGAGNAVIAHDNEFNRWVAGKSAVFFKNDEELDSCLEQIVADEGLRNEMGRAARARFDEEFEWQKICRQYEDLFEHAFFGSIRREQRWLNPLTWSRGKAQV